MNPPTQIQFKGDSQNILFQTLLSSSPKEGCALLIGKEKNSHQFFGKNIWEICFIWPCCNIWEVGKKNFPESSFIKNTLYEKPSTNNRFAIDPLEQLYAQKWARKKKISVLGYAHSHPFSSPIPSKFDLAWKFSTGLIMIVNGSNQIRAWWINNSEKLQSKEIPLLNSH